MDQTLVPELKIQHFEGPMDLLYHLVEKNDIDIFDIPIATICEQYMDYLDKMKSLDMEIASEFLVMAASLILIKTKMMLPGSKTGENGDAEPDPREDLVVSLMRYKRCKLFAEELKERREKYSGCRTRPAMTAKDLGIKVVPVKQEFSKEAFDDAVDDVCTRNEVRFADISAKITHILRKDKLSIRQRMKTLWKTITGRGKMFFSELFAGRKKDEDYKMEKIVSFLAILELVRNDSITVEQKRLFDDILIEEKKI